MNGAAVRSWNESSHLLGGGTKPELSSIKFDVEVVVSDSDFLCEGIA
jgi:hypothetical protein